MSFTETVALGALAGLTIYVGLPAGRLRLLGNSARVALAMFAVGVLAFLFVDVIAHAEEILEDSVTAFKAGSASLEHTLWLGVLLASGFAAGGPGLALIERKLRPVGPTRPPIAGASVDVLAADEPQRLALDADLARSRALRTGMVIAAAIGLHNFAEGLAIGVSARAGEIGLATVLIVGFALHNATEGFGIIGPLGSIRPSWGWLGLVGLVGGGPTFLGSIVGYNVTSHPLELLFYALAGGAIFYVIGEIWAGMRRHGHRELGLWALSLGFFVAIATDMVVVYGGG